jgi:flagellar L-ring protein precursor FlgH
MMQSIFSKIVLATLCVTYLTGCSTHLQNTAALEFEPIYPNELDIPLPSNATGGIYSEAKGGLFATDKRASVIGDILTVNLSESFSATKAQTASSSKSDSFDVTMPVGLPNIVTGGFSEAGSLTSGTEQSFSGSGAAAQSNTLSGFLAVTVVRVHNNGNMEIAGQKKLNLNNGDEYVRLTGIIRPNDISASNLVNSSRIANAEITYVGAGQVADTGRKGWLSNAMRTISPF